MHVVATYADMVLNLCVFSFQNDPKLIEAAEATIHDNVTFNMFQYFNNSRTFHHIQ